MMGLRAVPVGLAIWYGSLAPAPAHGAYATSDDVVTGYERYVGDRVEIGGQVVSMDPVTIAVTNGDERRELRVTGATGTVRRGERIRVFGILESDGTVHATDAFTVRRGGLVYTRVVSLLAGLWVLWRLLAHWRLDTDRFALERRPMPRAVRAAVGAWFSRRRDGDA